jgi:type I restriction-modification system DNA methylase subunit
MHSRSSVPKIKITRSHQMTEQIRQTVLNILEKLPTRKLDALKQLFWSELNYEQINQDLPMRDWPEETKSLLVGNPNLFAGAGDDNGFHVIFCQLCQSSLSFVDERILISKLSINHPYALYIFSDKELINWHFVNIKYERKDELKAKHILRRISVGPFERLRTATERISLIDIANLSPDLLGISPLVIQHRHNEAFDVEAVTVQFFTRYREIFEAIESSLEIKNGLTIEKRRLFTQKFFNRLMFLVFLERKGWLTFKNEKEYLLTLSRDYIQNESNKLGGFGFHRSRLNTLFFNTLNNREGRNRINDPAYAVLREKVGDAPYLNGGLFEEGEGDHQWYFPDKEIFLAIAELFYAFNFTVSESTSLDIEVAVDPEMLGKIFEELVTGRHETGSYYTPKSVVAFMCRETLKGYLESECGSETSEEISEFVEFHIADNLHDPERVLEALCNVKVCDPACGSGAYLLGMLHELLDLRASLFKTRQLDTRTIYERKLEIIQKNLYGVDKDLFAVNIARLRLWLSLVVDDPRNPLLEPGLDVSLPNLDFKIEAGDSLTAPDPAGGLELGFRAGLIDEYLDAKEQFLYAHGNEKEKWKQIVINLKNQIQQWLGRSQNLNELDWAVEFAEIFSKEQKGFDILIANPPYGIVYDLESKEVLEKLYDSFKRNNDIYVAFYQRGIQLLRAKGEFSYISPNTFLNGDYFKLLRKFLTASAFVKHIRDFKEYPVFKDPTVFVCIFNCKKETNPEYPYQGQISLVNDNLDIYAEKFFTIKFSSDQPFKEENTLLNKIMSTVGFCVLDEIFYVKDVGFNYWTEGKGKKRDGNSIGDRVFYSGEKQHLGDIPFLKGRDISKWVYSTPNNFLRHDYQKYLDSSVDTFRFSQEYFCVIPKIVYRQTSSTIIAAIDDQRVYLDKTVHLIVPKDNWQKFSPLALLGILNSRLFAYFYQYLSQETEGRAFAQVKTTYIKKLPIPLKTSTEAISETVSQILEMKKENPLANVSHLEEAIDQLVYLVYELDSSDKKLVDLWYTSKNSKRSQLK